MPAKVAAQQKGSLNMTTVDDNATQRLGAPREGLLARHPLVFFFVIAYAGT